MTDESAQPKNDATEEEKKGDEQQPTQNYKEVINGEEVTTVVTPSTITVQPPASTDTKTSGGYKRPVEKQVKITVG